MREPQRRRRARRARRGGAVARDSREVKPAGCRSGVSRRRPVQREDAPVAVEVGEQQRCRRSSRRSRSRVASAARRMTSCAERIVVAGDARASTECVEHSVRCNLRAGRSTPRTTVSHWRLRMLAVEGAASDRVQRRRPGVRSNAATSLHRCPQPGNVRASRHHDDGRSRGSGRPRTRSGVDVAGAAGAREVDVAPSWRRRTRRRSRRDR